MAEEEEIRVRASLRDELSLPARKAAEAIDDLGDEALQTAAELEALGKAADDAADQVDDLADSTEGLTRSQLSQRTASKQLRGENGRFVASQKKVTDEVEGSTRAFKGFFKIQFKIGRLFKLFKWGLMIDGALMLGAALNALGAAAVGAVAGLAPMSGVLGAYPGLLAAGVQGMAAFKIATKGLGEAIKVMNDPNATAEDLREALKGMHRNQVLFARSIADTKDETEKLRRSVGGAFFSGLDRQVDRLGKTYFPILNKRLTETAQGFNDIAHYTSEWLNSTRMSKNIDAIMKSQAKVIEGFGRGGSNFLRGMMWVLRAAQPMMREMSTDFRKLMRNFGNWTRGNQKKMRKFFSGGYDRFKEFLDVLGDFAVGLYNIGKNADAMSDFLGDSFSKMGEDFRKWTESSEGKKSIKQYFEDMVPIVEELGLWIRDIGIMLSGIALSDEFLTMSQELRTNTLPLLTEFLNKSAGKFLPLLNKLLEVLNKMADAGLLDSLATVIDGVLGIIDTLVSGLELLPDPLQEFATTLLTVMTALKFGGFLVGVPGKGRGKGGGGGFFGFGRGRGDGKPGGGRHSTKSPAAAAKPKGGVNPNRPGKHRTGGNRITSRLRPGGRAGAAAALAGAITMGGDDGVIGDMIGGGMMGSWFGPWGAAGGAVAGGAWSELKSSFNTPDSAESGNAQDIYDKLMSSDLGKFSKDFGINVEALATDVAKYGEDSKLLYEAAEKLRNAATAKGENTFKVLGTALAEFVTPGWRSKMTKAEDALDDLKAATEGIGGQVDKTSDKAKRMHILFQKFGGEVTYQIGATVDSVGIGAAIRNARNQLAASGVSGGELTGALKLEGLRFAGGNTYGGNYLTGELGPELWMNRSGAMQLLGANGPQIANLGPGAVIPASATADPFGGNTGDAPDWAVESLRRAAGAGLGGAIPRGSDGASAGGTVYTGPAVVIENLTATSDIDVERAVLRALRQAEREREERS